MDSWGTTIDLEQLHSKAIEGLKAGDRWDKLAAQLLVASTLTCELKPLNPRSADELLVWAVTIKCSLNPSAVGVPPDKQRLVEYQVGASLQQAKPEGCIFIDVTTQWNEAAEPPPPDPEPRRSVDNQGVRGRHEWKGLRFNSLAEVRVAQVLDQKGVLFFPNCLARLSLPKRFGEDPDTPIHRETREPDFLICHQGKWGILEIDGEPFHPARRKAQEDERDRLFKEHGVRVIEHYDAGDASTIPIWVVQRFLDLLEKS